MPRSASQEIESTLTADENDERGLSSKEVEESRLIFKELWSQEVDHEKSNTIRIQLKEEGYSGKELWRMLYDEKLDLGSKDMTERYAIQSTLIDRLESQEKNLEERWANEGILEVESELDNVYMEMEQILMSGQRSWEEKSAIVGTLPTGTYRATQILLEVARAYDMEANRSPAEREWSEYFKEMAFMDNVYENLSKTVEMRKFFGNKTHAYISPLLEDAWQGEISTPWLARAIATAIKDIGTQEGMELLKISTSDQTPLTDEYMNVQTTKGEVAERVLE